MIKKLLLILLFFELLLFVILLLIPSCNTSRPPHTTTYIKWNDGTETRIDTVISGTTVRANGSEYKVQPNQIVK